MQTVKPYSAVVAGYSSWSALKHAWVWPSSVSDTTSRLDDVQGSVNITNGVLLGDSDANGFNPGISPSIASGTLTVPGTSDFLLVCGGKKQVATDALILGDPTNGVGLGDYYDATSGYATLDGSNYATYPDLSLSFPFTGLTAVAVQPTAGSVGVCTAYAVNAATGVLSSGDAPVTGDISTSWTFDAAFVPWTNSASRVKFIYIWVFAAGIPSDIETGLEYMAANPLALPPTWKTLT